VATVHDLDSTVPAWLTDLVDDAAIFPPGNAPLDRAVDEHRAHQQSEYADLVGGFVVSDVKLPDLIAVLDAAADVAADTGVDEEDEQLAINLVVTGGAGAIEPAVRWATRAPLLRLVALECALRDEDDLARNAQRMVAAVDSVAADLGDATVYVEPPPLHGTPGTGWLAALDEVAARDLRLKFRTGGTTPDAFPTEAELAACIDAALDRELPFKCTAGLHRALRHRDEETGFEHHGFLNVLLATRRAFDGGSVAEVAEVLDDHYPNDLVALARTSDLAGARRWFTSYGSCSVAEPLDDLVALGLLEAPRA
jgi:hypothetical protein